MIARTQKSFEPFRHIRDSVRFCDPCIAKALHEGLSQKSSFQVRSQDLNNDLAVENLGRYQPIWI